MRKPGGLRWQALGALAACALALCSTGCFGSSSKSSKASMGGGQTIRFQKPTDTGSMPFTPAADVTGPKTVAVQPSAPPAHGPYGGSGSDLVCDRDTLIRYLEANPDRMRAWAGVFGINPSFKSVEKYIAGLHPVTLTRDTQVTNHGFVNGQATSFQSILEAGTAVLV